MTDSPGVHRLGLLLAWLGVLPFLGCALAIWASLELPRPLPDAAGIAASYALAIAVFMAGTHWGLALVPTTPGRLRLLLTSNAATLAAWFGFLAGQGALYFWLMSAVFAFLLRVDQSLYRAGIISDVYWKMRWRITGLVVLSLIAIAVRRHLTA